MTPKNEKRCLICKSNNVQTAVKYCNYCIDYKLWVWSRVFTNLKQKR